MREVLCPICEADHSSPLFCVEGLQLVRCSVCGLTYYNPDITPEEHYALLDEDFFVSKAIQKVKQSGAEYNFDVYMQNVKDSSIVGYPDYLEPEHLLAKELWGKKVLGWFIKEWQKQGFESLPSSILEIGAATGNMLVPFKDAEWDPVVGQEVSPWIAQFASTGIEVKVGELHDLDFGNAKFNCVLMWDSFEHVQFPNECLKKISEMTTDQALMVIQTPDVDQSCADWYLFSPRQHAYLYNYSTIGMLLEKHGFKIIDERISSQADERIYVCTKKACSQEQNKRKRCNAKL